MDEMEVEHVIKVTLTNEILKRISEIDDIFVSTIKEFVNMVAGSAINDLYTKHIDLDMTPPAILMSEQIAMLEKENDKILSINYKTEFGDIFMNLILFNQSKS